jgi:hypothetical protein
MNVANVIETKRRRTRRRTATQRRNISMPRSRGATQRPPLRFGWYAGLAVMATIEVIEWPLAILMMLGHEIAHRAHKQALRDFAEGVEAGA